MLAVSGGHVDTVSLLLERNADANMADNHGLTALHLGLLCGQEECLQCLLEQEASVLLGDARGRTAIHLAAARGHASWLGELLGVACAEPLPLPPLHDHGGYTPLHWACYYGPPPAPPPPPPPPPPPAPPPPPPITHAVRLANDHDACASLLLDAMGSDISGCRDAKDRTALHAAAFSGHVDCVQLLLSHDAPVDAVDQSGRTALMMAAEKGRVGVLEVLLSSTEASLSLADREGNTALHLTCSAGQQECVLLLLEKMAGDGGGLVNATNAALQTPLHLASRSGLKQAVQELLSRGAGVQTLDQDGSSGAASPGSLLRPLPHPAAAPAPATGPGTPRGPRNPSGTAENDSEDSETF
ncbi:hypothetical protein CRUP_018351 [Coryphaenoides rupestris]|nr:hypothetical protein CRUP_018351 [Coryphaenoides rupestris]